jgi:hypothetical protein
MTIAKYPDISHTSKLERDIAILQDFLWKTHEKEATTWASTLQGDHGEAYSFHDQTTHNIYLAQQ